MKTFGITGSQGFLGWHFRCLLHSKGVLSPELADRQEFAHESGYANFVKNCDVIVHCAGMARGTDEDVASTNIGIAQSLVKALEKSGRKPHIINASSIQISKDTAYGRSKREAGEILAQWADRVGAKFTNLIMPNLFGEGGRPFYNSVVATFCHQIVRDETPKILQDAEIPLLHAQSVCEQIWDIASKGMTGDIRPDGHRIKVSALLERIKLFHGKYASAGIIPAFKDDFTKDLFNTYRSYYFAQRPSYLTKLHSDQRGSLSEIVKSDHGGQAFFSTTKSGITRGNHYHRRKFERFAVIGGEASIQIRKLFSPEVYEFKVSGREPTWIDMPTLHTHNITNVGSQDLYTLFWSDEIFDPENPDTYPEKVKTEK
jgi:UDP-2-acetamido-2,6-beta-L-arabino-hexul-4-ose reductase